MSLEIEADSDFGEEPHTPSSRSPTTVDACLDTRWIWLSLQSNGLRYFQIDLSEVLKVKLEDGVGLDTDYSGMGGAEEAFQKMIETAPFSLEPRVWFQRCGDITASCREILASHKNDCCKIPGPECIFGDMMERCPPETLNEFRRVHKHGCDRARVQATKHTYICFNCNIRKRVGETSLAEIAVNKLLGIVSD